MPRILLLCLLLAGDLAWGQNTPPKIGLTRAKVIDDTQAEKARHEMVRQVIAREGIENPAVLQAMRTVPRHFFVPSNLVRMAYFDQALPIGFKQTISPPFIVAYMTQTLDPKPTDRVLEIGTGSGYQASILSGIVKEVYTIEIVKPLADQALQRFKDLGYTNVHAKAGDGYQGWPEHAPFDKIIVTCSPEEVPQPLIDQLKEGGRMIVPLGERYQQMFYLFEKKDGKLVKQKLIPTLFVPMTGTSEDRRKVLPDPLHPVLLNGSFEEVDEETKLPRRWHYQRQTSLMHDAPPDGQNYLRIQNTDPGRFAQILQAMAVDGKHIGAMEIRLWVRTNGIQKGNQRYERAGLIVHFFDENRQQFTQPLHPWDGTSAWRQISLTIPVPPKAKEAIFHVGLNGSVGTLDIDDIQMTPIPRSRENP
ncbi:MAG: protein-L-isoaspartate(D-aspartate) O-methyltransferase [Planctomycetales bacterium]